MWICYMTMKDTPEEFHVLCFCKIQKQLLSSSGSETAERDSWTCFLDWNGRCPGDEISGKIWKFLAKWYDWEYRYCYHFWLALFDWGQKTLQNFLVEFTKRVLNHHRYQLMRTSICFFEFQIDFPLCCAEEHTLKMDSFKHIYFQFKRKKRIILQSTFSNLPFVLQTRIGE